MILAEADAEIRRLSKLLDQGLDVVRTTTEKVAQAERDYRHGRGVKWVEAPPGTAAFREAWVDAETADLRYVRDLAEGERKAAIESVRSRQVQISAIQSLLAAHKAEAGFTRTTDFDRNHYPT